MSPSSEITFDRPIDRPDDAEWIFELAVAVAPEHVGGRHDRSAAGLDGAVVPGIDVCTAA